MSDIKLKPNQLHKLQEVLEKIANLFDFSLLSPFADRHDVSEVRFFRKHRGISEFVSIACDSTDRRSEWRCQFSAGASVEKNSGWEIIKTFQLSPSKIESKTGEDALRQFFELSAKTASKEASKLTPNKHTPKGVNGAIHAGAGNGAYTNGHGKYPAAQVAEASASNADAEAAYPSVEHSHA